MRRQRGIIALVGIDGSGKTTQAIRLTAALRAAGVPARYGPNPGGRRWLGRRLGVLPWRLRGVGGPPGELLGAATGRDPARLRGVLAVESVLRWLAIARSLLLSRVAVMDRYAICQEVSVRVHGGGRFASRAVKTAYFVFPEADLLIFLDVAPETAYERIEARGTDHEELSFLRATAEAYRELAVEAVRIDGGMSQDEVAQAVWKAVLTQTELVTG